MGQHHTKQDRLRADQLRVAVRHAFSDGAWTPATLAAAAEMNHQHLGRFMKGTVPSTSAQLALERALANGPPVATPPTPPTAPETAPPSKDSEQPKRRAQISGKSRKRVRVLVRQSLKKYPGGLSEMARTLGVRAEDLRRIISGGRATGEAWLILKSHFRDQLFGKLGRPPTFAPTKEPTPDAIAKRSSDAPAPAPQKPGPIQQELPFEQVQFPAGYTAADLSAKWGREAIAFVLQMSNERGGSQ